MKKIFVLMALSMLQYGMYAKNAKALKSVIYQDGTQKLNGLVTSNAGKKKLPGVLILPAWKGIDDEARNAALALEKQGYVVFIADIYGEGDVPADNAAAAAIAGKYKQDYVAYQRRIKLALEQLEAIADADKLAVIGYCFGGTGALETARANFPVKGVVSIHGGLGKDSTRANIPLNTKILIENPADDQSVTPEMMGVLIKEMNEGKADWQIITYAHCKHTFTDPQSPDYNEIMATRAWKHTLVFLKEVLK
jgi:dienelactone hydrolase